MAPLEATPDDEVTLSLDALPDWLTLDVTPSGSNRWHPQIGHTMTRQLALRAPHCHPCIWDVARARI